MDFQSILNGIDDVSKVLSHIMSVVAFIALVVKPIRDKLFGMNDIKEATKCQLRTDMLNIYFKHREENALRRYEKENYLFLYAAYKALGGNSFIDDITQEVRKWEVLP